MGRKKMSATDDLMAKTIYSTKFWAMVAVIVSAAGAAFTEKQEWSTAIGEIVTALISFIAARGAIDVAEKATDHHHRD